jgi:hypothetical protein
MIAGGAQAPPEHRRDGRPFQMKRTRSKETFGVVIKELKRLRETDVGELHLSIIERDGRRLLDMRFWLNTKRYMGPTTKGILLTPEELEVLRSQKSRVRKLLKP